MIKILLKENKIEIKDAEDIHSFVEAELIKRISLIYYKKVLYPRH